MRNLVNDFYQSGRNNLVTYKALGIKGTTVRVNIYNLKIDRMVVKISRSGWFTKITLKDHQQLFQEVTKAPKTVFKAP